jgi:nucleoside-triphosphatase
MNIFLTGFTRTGKSTLIQKALNSLEIIPCGFVTRAGIPNKDGSSEIYIHAANSSQFWESKTNRVGYRAGDGINRTGFPKVFDTFGVKILQNSKPPLILMDELGFMENEALIFQSEVLHTLAGTIPVLGVIKPKNTAFLNKVRSHKKTMLIEVTCQNRNELLPRLLILLRQELNL